MAPPSDDDRKYDLLKFCVELADRTSVRRATANTFFVSLHSIVAGVVTYLSTTKPSGAKMDDFSLVCLAAVGIVLSLTWWGILRYYRRLSKAKWGVINQLEKDLGLSPFVDEWALLHPGDATAGFFKKKAHREATVVEQIVPFVFLAIYIALAVRVLL